jgi:hypothetical protein
MNRKRHGAIVITLLSAAIAFAAIACGGPSGLGVNQIRDNPSLLQGTVLGIVGGFSPQDPRIFGVMDLSELNCNNPNCGLDADSVQIGSCADRDVGVGSLGFVSRCVKKGSTGSVVVKPSDRQPQSLRRPFVRETIPPATHRSSRERPFS